MSAPLTGTSEVVQEAVLPRTMDRRLAWLMAAASGLTAANLYYLQPILAQVGHELRVSPDQIGLVVTLTLIGYGLGMLFIVPLGDRINRRRLIPLMTLLVTLALVGVALSPNLIVLGLTSLVVGITTIVPQLLIPFAVSLTAPQERGRIVGSVMTGLLVGVLLSRTFSGYISAHFGWHMVYWIAAVLMLVLGIILYLALPDEQPVSQMRYSELLKSLGLLIRQEPILREVSLLGALVMASFNAFWATLSFFLEGAPYHYNSDIVGLFGLLGVAGALCANIVGRLADRMPARVITGTTVALSLASFLLLWSGGQWLWGLIVGVIALDFGMQGTQVSNQTRVYSLNPEARSRLNTIYMVTFFIGGSLGSMLGTWGWSLGGWNGVGMVSCTLLLIALGIYGFNSVRKVF
jgi:predicted MFS family arabinose efflux permease